MELRDSKKPSIDPRRLVRDQGAHALANMLAATSDRVGAGEPINVGAGQEVSINRIAELIGGPVVHGAPRGFDERFKRASIDRARDLLGWEPTVQIEEGMRRLLEAAQTAPLVR